MYEPAVLRSGLRHGQDYRNAREAISKPRPSSCLQARFEAIEDKLKLVQENLKYFLEIMQHKKSDALEWTVRMLDLWIQCAVIPSRLSAHPELSADRWLVCTCRLLY